MGLLERGILQNCAAPPDVVHLGLLALQTLACCPVTLLWCDNLLHRMGQTGRVLAAHTSGGMAHCRLQDTTEPHKCQGSSFHALHQHGWLNPELWGLLQDTSSLHDLARVSA